jgi:hypothetical protein
MDPFLREILEVIAAHDGRYGWYQIDRALSQFSPNGERNLPRLRGLTRVLRGLEDDGLIAAGSGHSPSLPVYSITARGRQALAPPVGAPLANEGR